MACFKSDELDVDELVDSDYLTSQFNTAADHLAKKLLPQGVDDSILLILYGYYKQATEGSCNVPRPSFFNFKGKSKWDAWKQLGDLSKTEAKEMYVETIKSLDPSFCLSEEKKETWVKVSTMLRDEQEFKEKTLADLIKEDNLSEFRESLSHYDQDQLKTVVDELDELGLALIHWAADSGYTHFIKLLLKKGADINRKDVDGQTALHYASYCGHVNSVRFLLQKGANKNILDNDGKGPCDMAGDNEIKDLLEHT